MIQHPASMSHAGLTPDQRRSQGNLRRADPDLRRPGGGGGHPGRPHPGAGRSLSPSGRFGSLPRRDARPPDPSGPAPGTGLPRTGRPAEGRHLGGARRVIPAGVPRSEALHRGRAAPSRPRGALATGPRARPGKPGGPAGDQAAGACRAGRAWRSRGAARRGPRGPRPAVRPDRRLPIASPALGPFPSPALPPRFCPCSGPCSGPRPGPRRSLGAARCAPQHARGRPPFPVNAGRATSPSMTTAPPRPRKPPDQKGPPPARLRPSRTSLTAVAIVLVLGTFLGPGAVGGQDREPGRPCRRSATPSGRRRAPASCCWRSAGRAAGHRRSTGAPCANGLFMGAIGMAIPNAVSFTVLTQVPAGAMAVVINMVPLIAYGLALAVRDGDVPAAAPGRRSGRALRRPAAGPARHQPAGGRRWRCGCCSAMLDADAVRRERDRRRPLAARRRAVAGAGDRHAALGGNGPAAGGAGDRHLLPARPGEPPCRRPGPGRPDRDHLDHVLPSISSSCAWAGRSWRAWSATP